MTRILRWSILGALLVGAAPAVHADEGSTAPLEFGLLGGGHVFNKAHWLGRSTESPEALSPANGFVFGARVGWNLFRHLSLEAEFAASPTETRDESSSMWVLGYRGQVLYDILGEGRWRPFVVAGGGALVSAGTDTDVVPSESDPTMHAGLGLKVALTDMFGLRLDGRVLAPPAVFGGIASTSDEKNFDGPDFEGLVSLYVSLGAAPPPPPPAPPPPPPPPPVDDDPDRDGIKGDADRCPDKAEDMDDFEDADGCPEADNDADGLADADDKCPTKAENKNGVDDDDGCPEEDTDGDGFFGSADKCPDAPESKNNYKDDDGCPDEVPAAVKKFTGVIEGINFETGSAKILKGSFAVLDRALDVLKEYGDIRLEISGHTDDRGKDEVNMSLSQKRADAVKAYFVGKGIAEARLVGVGKGESEPIADNKSSAGRAKNRRTEFKLLGN
jgi:OOP family OmpA-OmpF porin